MITSVFRYFRHFVLGDPVEYVVFESLTQQFKALLCTNYFFGGLLLFLVVCWVIAFVVCIFCLPKVRLFGPCVILVLAAFIAEKSGELSQELSEVSEEPLKYAFLSDLINVLKTGHRNMTQKYDKQRVQESQNSINDSTTKNHTEDSQESKHTNSLKEKILGVDSGSREESYDITQNNMLVDTGFNKKQSKDRENIYQTKEKIKQIKHASKEVIENSKTQIKGSKSHSKSQKTPNTSNNNHQNNPNEDKNNIFDSDKSFFSKNSDSHKKSRDFEDLPLMESKEISKSPMNSSDSRKSGIMAFNRNFKTNSNIKRENDMVYKKSKSSEKENSHAVVYLRSQNIKVCDVIDKSEPLSDEFAQKHTEDSKIEKSNNRGISMIKKSTNILKHIFCFLKVSKCQANRDELPNDTERTTKQKNTLPTQDLNSLPSDLALNSLSKKRVDQDLDESLLMAGLFNLRFLNYIKQNMQNYNLGNNVGVNRSDKSLEKRLLGQAFGDPVDLTDRNRSDHIKDSNETISLPNTSAFDKNRGVSGVINQNIVQNYPNLENFGLGQSEGFIAGQKLAQAALDLYMKSYNEDLDQDLTQDSSDSQSISSSNGSKNVNVSSRIPKPLANSYNDNNSDFVMSQDQIKHRNSSYFSMKIPIALQSLMKREKTDESFEKKEVPDKNIKKNTSESPNDSEDAKNSNKNFEYDENDDTKQNVSNDEKPSENPSNLENQDSETQKSSNTEVDPENPNKDESMDENSKKHDQTPTKKKNSEHDKEKDTSEYQDPQDIPIQKDLYISQISEILASARLYDQKYDDLVEKIGQRHMDGRVLLTKLDLIFKNFTEKSLNIVSELNSIDIALPLLEYELENLEIQFERKFVLVSDKEPDIDTQKDDSTAHDDFEIGESQENAKDDQKDIQREKYIDNKGDENKEEEKVEFQKSIYDSTQLKLGTKADLDANTHKKQITQNVKPIQESLKQEKDNEISTKQQFNPLFKAIDAEIDFFKKSELMKHTSKEESTIFASFVNKLKNTFKSLYFSKRSFLNAFYFKRLFKNVADDNILVKNVVEADKEKKNHEQKQLKDDLANESKTKSMNQNSEEAHKNEKHIKNNGQSNMTKYRKFLEYMIAMSLGQCILAIVTIIAILIPTNLVYFFRIGLGFLFLWALIMFLIGILYAQEMDHDCIFKNSPFCKNTTDLTIDELYALLGIQEKEKSITQISDEMEILSTKYENQRQKIKMHVIGFANSNLNEKTQVFLNAFDKLGFVKDEFDTIMKQKVNKAAYYRNIDEMRILVEQIESLAKKSDLIELLDIEERFARISWFFDNEKEHIADRLYSFAKDEQRENKKLQSKRCLKAIEKICNGAHSLDFVLFWLAITTLAGFALVLV